MHAAAAGAARSAPREGDRKRTMKPFVNIASPTGNVVLNFTDDLISDLGAFALGYREAAKQLAGRFGV